MDSLDLGSLRTLPPGSAPTFSDGLAGALSQDRSVFITSPTAEYIPQFEHGLVTVHLRDDGRFGLADPLNAPQIFSSAYPYLCAILRPVPEHDPLAVMWRSPVVADFVENKGSVVSGFGRLSKTFLDAFDLPLSEMVHRAKRASSDSETGDRAQDQEHLQWYVVAMRRAYDRLRYMPATFRDQVVQVVQLQRYWLLANAYLEYSRVRTGPPSSAASVIATRWMGTWTTDPATVQHLMGLGIPVWLVRTLEKVHADIQVRALVIVEDARHITSIPFFGEEPLYHGLPGEKHLEATMRACDTYRDLSRVPAPSLFLSDNYSSGLSKSQTPKLPSKHHADSSGSAVIRGAPSRLVSAAAYAPYPKTKPGKPHPSQIRGRDKFAEFMHSWMPAAIPTWTRAMQTVDRTEKARAANEIWGYWIPEPAILVSPKDAAKVERHVLNWLRARPNWLYLLRVPGSSATRVGTQAWHQFLNGVPDDAQEQTQTRVGQRNFEIRQIFGGVFAEADFAATEQGSVDWQGYSVSNLTDDLAPKILWEVFELGFRHELLAVEQFLRPQHTPRDRALQEDSVGALFPEGVVHAVPSLPTPHSHGLFASVPHRRVNALNAFKALLLQWPGCPSIISQHEPLRISDAPSVIEEVGFNLASFYVDTFFQLSGRAPIVPHLFPV